MTTFVIEPRDPLFVRDGRPMTMGGVAARSLPFPLPSTLAGLARTCAALDTHGKFNHSAPWRLLEEVAVTGPLLCSLSADGTVKEILIPAPRDLVWFGGEAQAMPTQVMGHRLRPSAPDAFGAGAQTDLPAHLRLIGLEQTPGKHKPAAGPSHLLLPQFLRWLSHPSPILECLGWSPLLKERRTHVAIDSDKGTAADGMLFSTEGWRFATRDARLGILFQSTDTQQRRLQPGIVNLGGERRVSFLREVGSEVWPAELPGAVAGLGENDLARVILLTPAIFPEGAVPQVLRGAEVLAAVVGRPEVVSGWDYATSKPKPTRRMAAAGSVYWVRVPSEAWLRETWFDSVCPDAQDRRDGFGLCALGVE